MTDNSAKPNKSVNQEKSPPVDNLDPFNTERPYVHRLNGWQKLVFYPLACLLWIYFRTWRFRVDEEERQILEQTPRPRMIVVWHNRSLLATEIVRRLLIPGQISSLVSPSKMAAWEVALFELFNINAIRGSTTRRSIQSSMEILRTFRKGDDVGISPDGPSGPVYSFQKGAVALANKAGVPIALIVPNCRLARRLSTWDKHLVPYPFATVHVRIRIISPDDPLWNRGMEEASEQIRRVCLEMTDDPF